MVGKGCEIQFGDSLSVSLALLQAADRISQSTLEQAILNYREFGTTFVRGMKLE